MSTKKYPIHGVFKLLGLFTYIKNSWLAPKLMRIRIRIFRIMFYTMGEIPVL